MRIVVVGAGVVGLATAYVLSRKGHAVTVVDQEDGVGKGASFANGAQLSYSYVAPLASFHVLPNIPMWLSRRDSPLRFSPSLDPRLWRWSLQFLGSCTGKKSERSTKRLSQLANTSRAMLHELIDQHAISFDYKRTGKLVVYTRRKSFEDGIRTMLFQKKLGIEQKLMDANACFSKAPSLIGTKKNILGGIYTDTDETGDCYAFCKALAELIQTPPYNVHFEFRTTVGGLFKRKSQITALDVRGGPIEADAYVLASGVDTVRIASTAGIRFPIYALRGYSITTPVSANAKGLCLSITDYDRKTVYAPLGDRLRVAGMIDIVRPTAPIDRQRISQLVRQAQNFLPNISEYRSIEPWFGQRPATPTGLPIIGGTKFSNLFVNTGQGALGFTLALGSAWELAKAMHPSAGSKSIYYENEAYS